MLKITDACLQVGGVAHLAAVNATFQPGTRTAILVSDALGQRAEG